MDSAAGFPDDGRRLRIPMAIGPDDPDFVTSLARGLAVIRAFGRESPSMTLAEVAERTTLSRPTARRFLLTLESLGYVIGDGKRFWLAPRALDLGYAYLSSLRIWEVVQPSMRAVVDELNESCSMGVLDGAEILYVARVPPKHLMSLQVNPGTRLPAHCTSIGRVLLADLDEPALAAFFRVGRRRAFTSRTVTAEKDLRRLLAGIRDAGYALIDQEVEEGLRAIAVPVRGRAGRAVAGLSVGAHTGRLSKADMARRVLPALRRCAREVEAILLRADHPLLAGAPR
jgi:IclR family pca regulon transcriptional regulator